MSRVSGSKVIDEGSDSTLPERRAEAARRTARPIPSWRAFSPDMRITAAAPSLTGEHSMRFSGSAIGREPRTSSRLTTRWYWAKGFIAALALFFTATIPSWAWLRPKSAR